MHAALWGTDHTELDRIVSATAGPRAAIALTRGRYPKAYRYVDDNEDVAAAVAGQRSTLLVVADGHNGASASHTAVEAVLEAFGDDPPERLDDAGWLELFGAVNETVISRKGVGSAQPASNTVLLVALAAGAQLSWASLGDAALVLARPGATRGRQLNKEAMRFVGYPMKPKALRSTVQRGTATIEPGEWVVLASDGLSEFTNPMRPADVVPRILAIVRDGSPETAAVTLVETACSAGAGDNVATAVLAP